MRFKTVQEILDWAAQFHGRLADLFNAASAVHQRQRVGLLLEYIADEESRLRNSLKSYEVEGADRLLATWFDKAPDIQLPEIPENLSALLESGKTDTILEYVVTLRDQMIDVYINLREQANNDSIRAVFDSLAQMEHNEKLTLVRDARHFEDV
ncbi:hypothetical protein [Aquisalimonas sp.]|uniref:hypothetical protein n=1 Tax=Aquisalimonas sp. TaxID=1872621 RepID=UPI0025BBB5E3|nr:hypothetical protein [Aquisalimonas sp.]